jgi:tetratricopeptide (TPR) repeat protein
VAEPTLLDRGLECLKQGKVDEAIGHLERATAVSPRDYRGFNYLGVAYAQKGRYNLAVGALQAALQLRSDIPSIHYNLGLALEKDGCPAVARDHFEQALRLNPSYDKAAEALRALDVELGESISSKSCARHPDEPAVAFCSFCHLPICAECLNTVDDRIFCPLCAEKQGKS